MPDPPFQPLTLSVEAWLTLHKECLVSLDEHYIPMAQLIRECEAQAQAAASLRQRLEERDTELKRLHTDFAALRESFGAQRDQLAQAQQVWTRLSTAVSCSSPDGSAELEQVEYAYERASQAEAALVEMQKHLEPDEPLSLVGDPYKRGYLTAKLELREALAELQRRRSPTGQEKAGS